MNTRRGRQRMIGSAWARPLLTPTVHARARLARIVRVLGLEVDEGESTVAGPWDDKINSIAPRSSMDQGNL